MKPTLSILLPFTSLLLSTVLADQWVTKTTTVTATAASTIPATMSTTAIATAFTSSTPFYVTSATSYYDSEPSSGSTVDNAGGASGSDSGAFTLSHGAVVAISVVVALVATFGIASTVLYFVAKKRQWEVRKSIRRVSRRLTGKGPEMGKTAEALRRSRRQGAVRVESPVPIKKAARDVEKANTKDSTKTTEIEMEVKPAKSWKAIMPPSWPGRRN